MENNILNEIIKAIDENNAELVTQLLNNETIDLLNNSEMGITVMDQARKRGSPRIVEILKTKLFAVKEITKALESVSLLPGMVVIDYLNYYNNIMFMYYINTNTF